MATGESVGGGERPGREARRTARKKDAPDGSDAAGLRALLAAQAIQREMVGVTEGACGGDHGMRRLWRRRRVMVGREGAEGGGLVREALSAMEVTAILGGDGGDPIMDTGTCTGRDGRTAAEAMYRFAWNAPGAPDPSLVLPPVDPSLILPLGAASAASPRRSTTASTCTSGGNSLPLRWSDLRLYPAQHPHLPRRPRRRVVLDGFATARECRSACGAAVVAMEGLASRDGETVLAADDWDVLRAWAGGDAAALVARLCARTRRAVAAEFAEPRPLFLAGSLLTRLQARPQARGGRGRGGGGSGEVVATDDDDRYDSLAAHVDAANIASYDYSAVLYLNAAGHSFEGGEFVFRDGAGAAGAAEARRRSTGSIVGEVALDGPSDEECSGEDQVLEPARGRLLLFTSGCENLHQVMAVKPREKVRARGGGAMGGQSEETDAPAAARFVLAMWFTLCPCRGHDIPDLGLDSVLVPAVAADASTAGTKDTAPGGSGGGGGGEDGVEVSDLERMLEQKVASVKSALGMSDQQLAQLLAKLGT